MARTARLGTNDALLGASLVPGLTPEPAAEINVTASNALVLTQTARSGLQKPTASNSLSLTQTARAGLFKPSASNSLSLTQAARSGLHKPTASNTLALTSEARSDEFTLEASNALALSQTADVTKPPIHKSASNALALSTSVVGEGALRQEVANTLELTQEIGHNLIFVSASNPILLIDVSRVADTFEADASVAFSLTQESTGFSGRFSLENTLSLEQIGDTTTKTRSVSNALALTATASVELVKTVSNSLSLTQGVVQGIIGLDASNALALTQLGRIINITLTSDESVLDLVQTVETNIKMLSFTDTIGVDHSLNVLKPIYRSPTNELITIEEVFDIDSGDIIEVESGLSQTATAALDGPRALSHILSFVQTASAVLAKADGTDASASNSLSLTNEAKLSTPRSAETSKLILTQTATGTVSDVAENELSSLDVEVDALVVRGITATNTLAVNQATAYVFEKDTTKCFYTPFVGTNSDPDAPTPPPSTYTAAGATEGVRLQYPADGSVTDELILKGPNLGNRDRLAMTRINRETRGGTLIIFADPDWPKVETLLMSFSGLTKSESRDLLTFMESHLGEEVKFIDWEDRLWKGIISEPQDPVVQDGRSECSFTASFAFEGEKV